MQLQQHSNVIVHEAQLQPLDVDTCAVTCSLGTFALRGGRTLEGAQTQRGVAGALAGAAPPRPGPAGSCVPVPAGSSARCTSAAPAAGSAATAPCHLSAAAAGSGGRGASPGCSCAGAARVCTCCASSASASWRSCSRAGARCGGCSGSCAYPGRGWQQVCYPGACCLSPAACVRAFGASGTPTAPHPAASRVRGRQGPACQAHRWRSCPHGRH